jgi:hypothetical protein
MGRSVMNIQPISNSISMQAKPPKGKGGKKPEFIDKVKQSVLDMFSTATINEEGNKLSRMDSLDKGLSNPAINRAIMGGTAIILQPSIDWMNKSVDEETRRISVCRTVAKIIAGTTVGILVRGSSHKIVEKMTNLEGKTKNSMALIPKSWIQKFKDSPKLLSNYQSALSTGIAIVAMCFTNFAFDAPFTIKLTNKFKSLSDKKLVESKAKEEKNVEVAYG